MEDFILTLSHYLFLETRAEILEKNFVGFLEDLKTPKGHFEINRSLAMSPIRAWFGAFSILLPTFSDYARILVVCSMYYHFYKKVNDFLKFLLICQFIKKIDKKAFD